MKPIKKFRASFYIHGSLKNGSSPIHVVQMSCSYENHPYSMAYWYTIKIFDADDYPIHSGIASEESGEYLKELLTGRLSFIRIMFLHVRMRLKILKSAFMI